MDGNTQDPGYLRRSGSRPRHRAGTPCRRPCLGLSAVAVSLPMLLCLALFPRSRSGEGGSFVPVHGAPGHLLGDSAPLAFPYYAGGFVVYVPVLYQRLLCAILYCTDLALFSSSKLHFYSLFLMLNLPRVEFKLFAQFD